MQTFREEVLDRAEQRYQRTVAAREESEQMKAFREAEARREERKEIVTAAIGALLLAGTIAALIFLARFD